MRTHIRLLPGLLLPLALACGGSTGTSPVKAPVLATGLTYTAPAGAGWRLVQDAASTPTRLILDLVGPAATPSRGAGFNLQAPAGVRFGTFPETGFPINDTGVYELLNQGAPYHAYPYESKLLAGGVKPGNLLTVGIFQKDRRFSPKASDAPLLQIALELDPTAGLHAGDVLPLTVPKARILPGDIGGSSAFPAWAGDAEFYDAQAKAHAVPITIAVGTLAAN